jgi:tetratricopeptide (TPR) repeat protein
MKKLTYLHPIFCLKIMIGDRFDPNQSPGLFMFLGIGYFLKGQYVKAMNVLNEGLNRKPDWVGNHIILTAVYAQSGRSGDAKREAQEVLRLEPFFGSGWMYSLDFSNILSSPRVNVSAM